MNIPELLLEVIVRLPLKSIARFRSVSKEWKLLFDSQFFRDYFMSLNSSSSVSWSIIQTKPHKLTLEILGHHGCKTWGLTRSPGSLVSFSVETTIKKLLVLSCTDGLVLIYAESSNGTPLYYIGNPIIHDWFQIPLPPPQANEQHVTRSRNSYGFNDSGLLTKMENGIVVSYKVVLMLPYNSRNAGFAIFSSSSGTWDIRKVSCLHSNFWFTPRNSIALNEILHWFTNSSVVAYDFSGVYAAECQIIYTPDRGNQYGFPGFRKTITTTEGSIVYFNEFRNNGTRTLHVWRLVSYTNGPEAWQLFWKVNLMSLTELGIDYFPVVMHPLNSEIIYLWCMSKRGMIIYNLKTHVFNFHKETQDNDSKCMDGCTLSFNNCSEYMEDRYNYYFPSYQVHPNQILFSQFVLPRWLHRLPRPPP